MANLSTLSDPAIRILAGLLNLAAQAGFTVPGLPGWASVDEFEVGVEDWGTHELIPAQTSRELTDDKARGDEPAGRPRYRWFNGEDLVRLGFVEERVMGRTHVYRLLRAGAALRLLEWREPTDGV